MYKTVLGERWGVAKLFIAGSLTGDLLSAPCPCHPRQLGLVQNTRRRDVFSVRSVEKNQVERLVENLFANWAASTSA